MTKITFLGDIMFDFSMVEECRKNGIPLDNVCFSRSVQHISSILSESDYTFANLETPISFDDTNLTYRKYEFNTSIQFAKAVKDAGVDFVTTANNHMLDRGMDGLLSTYKSLKSIGLRQCGINTDENSRFEIVEINGIKIGILAYTYGTNAFSNHQYLSLKEHQLKAVNMLQEQEGNISRLVSAKFGKKASRIYDRIEGKVFPLNSESAIYEKRTLNLYRNHLIKQDMKQARKKNVDLLVACLHIGGQYRTEPLAYTKETAEWFIKRGCNAVICNHEHVIHGVSITSNRRLTAYALGNCLGSSGVTTGPYGRRSEYSIALHVYLKDDGSVDKYSFSILKTILTDDKYFETWPVYDLLQVSDSTDEYRKLLDESLSAAYDFSGKEYNEIKVEMFF